MSPKDASEDELSAKLIQYLRRHLDNINLNYSSSLTPILGGYDAAIYRFSLSGVQAPLSNNLVLRLFPSIQAADKATYEGAVQNALVREGYPAAAAHVVCADKSVLGGAFIVMERLPGEPLLGAPANLQSTLLGETHADLHAINPDRLIDSLQSLGMDRFRMDDRLNWLDRRTADLPTLRRSFEWILGNRPEEPRQLSICHGDFHKLNVLFKNGKATGVLDWSAFAICESAYDVAGTWVTFNILSRRLIERGEFEPADMDLVLEQYLAGYQSKRRFDRTHFDYFCVFRCLSNLTFGMRDVGLWRHEEVILDALEYISFVTDLPMHIDAR